MAAKSREPQGLLTVMVADAAPPDLRGTAFGLLNLTIGVGLLIGNVLAGALWSILGPATTFVAGSIFAALALVGLFVAPRTLGR